MDSGSLGAVRVAISVAVLASVPASWGQSHALHIGATVVPPSGGCRFDAAGYHCDGASASTVTWSVSPASRARMSQAASARLSGAGAAVDLRGTLASLDTAGLVLTVTP